MVLFLNLQGSKVDQLQCMKKPREAVVEMNITTDLSKLSRLLLISGETGTAHTKDTYRKIVVPVADKRMKVSQKVYSSLVGTYFAGSLPLPCISIVKHLEKASWLTRCLLVCPLGR